MVAILASLFSLTEWLKFLLQIYIELTGVWAKTRGVIVSLWRTVNVVLLLSRSNVFIREDLIDL
jgi:hypothetical protein